MANPTIKRFREIFWSWVAQEVAKQPLFKKWVKTLCLENSRESTGFQKSSSPTKGKVQIDSSFEAVVDFYHPQDEFDLKKIFDDIANLYREKVEKQKIIKQENHGEGECVERDSLIVLDNASGLADRSPSFVTFMTTCRKFGHSLLYVFHETAISSPCWKDIISQTQIFCVFSSAMDLVLNHLLKFVTRNGGKGYISR